MKTKLITRATGITTFLGLPIGLTIGKTGASNSLVAFEYGHGPTEGQAASYQWNSGDEGDERGLATDDGAPLRMCKVKLNGNQQKMEC